jgi:hypothetical protein
MGWVEGQKTFQHLKKKEKKEVEGGGEGDIPHERKLKNHTP